MKFLVTAETVNHCKKYRKVDFLTNTSSCCQKVAASLAFRVFVRHHAALNREFYSIDKCHDKWNELVKWLKKNKSSITQIKNQVRLRKTANFYGFLVSILIHNSVNSHGKLFSYQSLHLHDHQRYTAMKHGWQMWMTKSRYLTRYLIDIRIR